MSDLRFYFPDVYRVIKTGEQEVMRPVTVQQFAWFCEREDCGWSGVGHESEGTAVDEALRHQRRDHPEPQ